MLCASSGEYSETVITCSIVTGINVHSVILKDGRSVGYTDDGVSDEEL